MRFSGERLQSVRPATSRRREMDRFFETLLERSYIDHGVPSSININHDENFDFSLSDDHGFDVFAVFEEPMPSVSYP